VCVGLTGVPPAGVSVRLVYELHVIGLASAPSALGLDEFRVATSAAQPSPSGTTCVLLPLPSGGLTGFGAASIVHTAANVRPIGLWLVGVDASGATYCTRESAPTNAAHPPFAVTVLAAYQVVDSYRQNFAAVQSLQSPLPFGACLAKARACGARRLKRSWHAGTECQDVVGSPAIPGYYWVNPAGDEFITYCDVDAEGVWTLVAQEVRSLACT
jgi:hypothetical protein